jgi:GxxExxY protein
MLAGDALTERVIGLAIDVHRHLGPGLLESVYEQCLCYELTHAGVPHQRQAPLPVIYKGVRLETAFRADILVADEVILELKSVECLSAVHEAQLLTYLRMTGYRVGLLMNFNTLRLIDGLRRFAM